MAMPPGNVVIPAAGGGGNEIHQKHHHRQQWFPVDERDGFISWLRGEFAAANAIIDTLCHHLKEVGNPGEYDVAIASIQQRRCNWNPVLHMQQFYSIGEVVFSLQQVALRKQQQLQQHRYFNDHPKNGGKDYRRSSSAGFNRVHRGDLVKPLVNPDGKSSNSEEIKLEDKNSALAEDEKDDNSKPQVDSLVKSSNNSEGNLSDNLESSPKENGSNSGENLNVKQNHIVTPKTFVSSEMVDGKMVNVVDGLKLYEQVLDDVEVSKIVSLVDDLRESGRRGQFEGGQTYVVWKRPMRGHGREILQLGIPVVDAPPEDENAAPISKERRSEPIPTLLEDVIERFVGKQIMTVKPDACIIDIYNEGDFSQPHMWPSWFGKPVLVLFLTECDLMFGRLITADHPGDYKGSLKLSLKSGSLLVMQGRSTDISKHAIPATRKQRILVTFTKFQPRKLVQYDGPRVTSPATGPSPHWGPPPSRSPNHVRHTGPKHYSATLTSGVLPAPAPPNGAPPLFVAAPAAFPAPVSTAWAAGPPRHHPPPPSRLPAPPGTGVFLPPPGPGNASAPQVPAGAENGPEKFSSANCVDRNGGAAKEENRQNEDS